MPFKPAPRLQGFDYLGAYRYFLTICTKDRNDVFVQQDAVEPILSQLRQSSESFHFAVIAYCFMPDHLHLLVEGTTDDADLQNFVRVFKQRSSFNWRRRHGQRLWQRGYFDRVLEADEDTVEVARYLLANPLRAGLVSTPEDYPFLGSMSMELAELLDSVRQDT